MVMSFFFSLFWFCCTSHFIPVISNTFQREFTSSWLIKWQSISWFANFDEDLNGQMVTCSTYFLAFWSVNFTKWKFSKLFSDDWPSLANQADCLFWEMQPWAWEIEFWMKRPKEAKKSSLLSQLSLFILFAMLPMALTLRGPPSTSFILYSFSFPFPSASSLKWNRPNSIRSTSNWLPAAFQSAKFPHSSNFSRLCNASHLWNAFLYWVFPNLHSFITRYFQIIWSGSIMFFFWIEESNLKMDDIYFALQARFDLFLFWHLVPFSFHCCLLIWPAALLISFQFRVSTSIHSFSR